MKLLVFHPYGFFIGIAILVSAWISESYRKKYYSHLPFAICHELIWWILIPGIIGARLYHVLDFWQFYSKDLIKVFYVWEGGLGILGAIMGGIFGLGVYSLIISWKRLNSRAIEQIAIKRLERKEVKKLLNYSITQLLNLLDVVVIGLPVGQAIGRLGNFFNQELYGLPTSLPWGIYIRPENRLVGYEGFEYFHPLFAYEAIWCVAIFIIIISVIKVKKERKEGVLFFTYLFLYSFGRFWLEFLRPENWMMVLPIVNWHLRVAQVISIIFIIVSLRFFVWS